MKEKDKGRDRYRICESILEGNVEDEVNTLLNEGWVLHGDLHVIKAHDAESNQEHIHYIQAMVRD